MFTKFFKTPITEDEILLFTTFVLDEAVLVSLLNENSIDKNQRIIVYHDILRHRNPGYLLAHYPKATVYSVILLGATKKCPVFHSKLWARIKNNKFNKIAITSANLSAYHLVDTGEKSGTFESFIEVDRPNEKLLNSFIFSNLNIKRDPKRHKKLKAKPETILIDTRRGFSAKLSKNRIFEIIQQINEAPIMCAAPFLNGKAIDSILNNNKRKKFTAYTGRNNKTGLALHAKLFLFEKTAILGSANLTAQALGTNGKTINHELVLLKKHNNKEFSGFKKFEKVDFLEFKADNPGDNDPEDDLLNTKDWSKQRLERINAPDDAILRIYGEKACIKFVGKWKTGKIIIASKYMGNTVPLSVSNNIAKPSKRDKHLFAEIISKGNVEIRCINYGKITWRTELNYGEFWQALELRSHFNSASGNSDGAKQLKSKQQTAQYDVRDMRQLAISDPDKGEKIAPFVRWLSKEGISVAHIPEWCQKLALEIKEGKA